MINAIKKRFDNWKRYNRTYNELAEMSEGELRDLNICRADISRLARQAMK